MYVPDVPELIFVVAFQRPRASPRYATTPPRMFRSGKLTSYTKATSDNNNSNNNIIRVVCLPPSVC